MINFRAPGGWNGGTLQFLPFESPESVRWKFSWANAITSRATAALFHTAVKHIDTIWQLNLPANFEEWINSYRENEVLSRATICDALQEEDWIVFELDYLRFCPICLGAAYHTWWHQCRLHSICLIHGCSLISGCANCNAPIPIEMGAKSWTRKPYICSRCAQPLTGVTPTWDATEDLTAIQSVLASRYSPWMDWLNDLAAFRKGWFRIHRRWYSETDDDRLRKLRAARELEAIRLICPPPGNVRAAAYPIVDIKEIGLYEHIDYDPGRVIADFVSEIKETFGQTDHEHFRFCEQHFSNGLRIHAGNLMSAPLSLWLVILYARWCQERSDSRKVQLPEEAWVDERDSRKVQLPEEAWVDELSSIIGVGLLDARGLRTLFSTIYSELLAWLSHFPTRECFDLELDRLSLSPGISGYEIRDDDGYRRSVLLVRPNVGIRESGEFHLTSDSPGISSSWLLEKRLRCYSYPFEISKR